MQVESVALNIRGMTVAYDARPVLWNVDLAVASGLITGIVGPNGAGKSTLLKAALGIIPKLSGQVEVLGEPLRPNRSRIGYVPQRTSVDWDFPTSVFDLVLMGTYGRLGWLRRPGRKEKEATRRALQMVEMEEFANRQIGELSGGQQQRVFLARAFVQDVPLYFMDEPFAGVDATTEKAIVKLLHKFRNLGKTLIVVHHDLSTVFEYFDEVVLLNGRVIAAGQVSEVFTNANLETTYGGQIPQIRAGIQPQNQRIAGCDSEFVAMNRGGDV